MQTRLGCRRRTRIADSGRRAVFTLSPTAAAPAPSPAAPSPATTPPAAAAAAAGTRGGCKAFGLLVGCQGGNDRIAGQNGPIR